MDEVTNRIMLKMLANTEDEHIIEACEEFITIGKLIYLDEVQKEMAAAKIPIKTSKQILDEIKRRGRELSRKNK